MKKLPALQRYLDHAQSEVLPQIKASAFTVHINSEQIDAKICFELGAAILLDKPIIIVVPEGRPVAANLKRCATAIVEGDASDALKFQKELAKAIQNVMANDSRIKK